MGSSPRIDLLACSALPLLAGCGDPVAPATPFWGLVPIIAAIAGALLAVGGGLIQFKIVSRKEVRTLRRTKLEELYTCSLQIQARAVEIVQSLTQLSSDLPARTPSNSPALCDPVRLVMLTAIYEPKLSPDAMRLREAFDKLRTTTQKILLDQVGKELLLTESEIGPAVDNLKAFQEACEAFQQHVIDRTRKFL